MFYMACLWGLMFKNNIIDGNLQTNIICIYLHNNVFAHGTVTN